MLYMRVDYDAVAVENIGYASLMMTCCGAPGGMELIDINRIDPHAPPLDMRKESFLKAYRDFYRSEIYLAAMPQVGIIARIEHMREELSDAAIEMLERCSAMGLRTRSAIDAIVEDAFVLEREQPQDVSWWRVIKHWQKRNALEHRAHILAFVKKQMLHADCQRMNVFRRIRMELYNATIKGIHMGQEEIDGIHHAFRCSLEDIHQEVIMPAQKALLFAQLQRPFFLPPGAQNDGRY